MFCWHHIAALHLFLFLGPDNNLILYVDLQWNHCSDLTVIVLQ